MKGQVFVGWELSKRGGAVTITLLFLSRVLVSSGGVFENVQDWIEDMCIYIDIYVPALWFGPATTLEAFLVSPRAGLLVRTAGSTGERQVL